MVLGAEPIVTGKYHGLEKSSSLDLVSAIFLGTCSAQSSWSHSLRGVTVPADPLFLVLSTILTMEVCPLFISFQGQGNKRGELGKDRDKA